MLNITAVGNSILKHQVFFIMGTGGVLTLQNRTKLAALGVIGYLAVKFFYHQYSEIEALQEANCELSVKLREAKQAFSNYFLSFSKQSQEEVTNLKFRLGCLKRDNERLAYENLELLEETFGRDSAAEIAILRKNLGIVQAANRRATNGGSPIQMRSSPLLVKFL